MKTRNAKKIACPACGAALIYDPGAGKLRCDSCGSTFLPDELGKKPDDPGERPGLKDAASGEINREELECRIFTCSSCGAQLNINDTECSTFCPYCGQPTLVFDRIGTMTRPDVIIPFSVTRQRAAQLLREKLRKGRYVPPDLREVPIDRISGIYIPYWIYDIDCSEKAVIRGYPDEDSHDPRFFYLDAERHFSAIPGEGAVRLDDEMSKKLEPYHIDGAKPFDPSYLSGFYSDRCDADPSELEKAARTRAHGFLEGEMVKKIDREEDMEYVTIIRKTENSVITNRRYAFFPAWFLTFRWQDKPVTILVNGQTGEASGGLPVNKKAYAVSAVLSCIWTIPAGILFAWFTMWINSDSAVDRAGGYGILAICVLILAGIGAGGILLVKKSNKLSQADDTRSYAFDREKGGRS